MQNFGLLRGSEESNASNRNEEEKKSKGSVPFSENDDMTAKNRKVDARLVKELVEDNSVSRITNEDKGAMSEEEKLTPQALESDNNIRRLQSQDLDKAK